ncbi:MAG: type II toxin-antitoxin system HicB family antitoxin [Acidobacteriota bacterium]|nr:type II toxin-antitoxin system HicB family antitoxin [Acidobacteriota bacterium]
MKVKVVVHEADEGGYWAEVPAIPGCSTQGDTLEELITNLHEAIEGCMSVDVKEPQSIPGDMGPDKREGIIGVMPRLSRIE